MTSGEWPRCMHCDLPFPTEAKRDRHQLLCLDDPSRTNGVVWVGASFKFDKIWSWFKRRK